jgi:hypothetical protein
MSRVFVAGANCCRTHEGRSAVLAARAQIEAHGHEVVTPFGMGRVLSPEVCTDGEIRSDARALSTCELLALMPGWRTDAEILRLLALAQTMNIPVHEMQTLQVDAPASVNPGASS